MRVLVKIYSTLFLLFFVVALFGQELRSTAYNEALVQKQYLQKIKEPRSLKKQKGLPQVALPFFDDFTYYYKQSTPNADLWADASVYVNCSFADSMVSVGVVTLDAVDAQGNVYAVDDSKTASDTLSSNYIKLAGKASKVFVSFFVQGGGKGDRPEEGDSLILEFYNSKYNRWSKAWDTTGYKSGDTLAYRSSYFNQVILEVPDTCKTDSFRIRFRNYTTMSEKAVIGRKGALSNVDYWHLDYIEVKEADNREEMTKLNDVMFVEPLKSSLKKYQAVPWDHYGITNRFKTTNNIPTSFQLVYPDRDVSMPITRHHQILDFNGYIIDENPLGTEADEEVNKIITYTDDFVNNDIAEDSDGKVTYRAYLDVANSSENKLSNDTIYRTEVYEDYYAYDDGVPELGFGISGDGAYLAQIAVKYSPFVNDQFIDTLSALDIYFNKTRNNVTASTNFSFRIALWGYSYGEPGDLLYSSDETNLFEPRFDSTGNEFYTCAFDSALLIRDTAIFVGIIQETTQFLNIGYDLNNDSRKNLYINTSSSWYRVDSTLLPGTVMIRPVFGKFQPREIKSVRGKNTRLLVRPNPVVSPSVRLKISDEYNMEEELTDGWRYEVYDCMGKQVKTGLYEGELPVSDLYKGMYILRVINTANNQVLQEKLVKLY